MTVSNGISGYVAGIASTIILYPLDVIKMSLIMPPSHLKLGNNLFQNISKSASFILNKHGILSFYQGMMPNLIKTGASSSLFFMILRQIQPFFPLNSISSNFLASSLSRIASSLITNPLSVIETRYQIVGSNRWSGSVTESFKRLYMHEGLQGYYKGSLANCYKQGMFAGIYYSLYTLGKDIGIAPIISGLVSGLISTVATHPFEIVRISEQGKLNYGKNNSIGKQLFCLVQEGELLKGVGPRIVKKPLANTITFFAFEIMEKKNNLQ